MRETDGRLRNRDARGMVGLRGRSNDCWMGGKLMRNLRTKRKVHSEKWTLGLFVTSSNKVSTTGCESLGSDCV